MIRSLALLIILLQGLNPAYADNYFAALKRNAPRLYILFGSLITTTQTDDSFSLDVAQEARNRLFGSYFKENIHPSNDNFKSVDSLSKVVVGIINKYSTTPEELHYLAQFEAFYWDWGAMHFNTKLTIALADEKLTNLIHQTQDAFAQLINAQSNTLENRNDSLTTNNIKLITESYRLEAWMLAVLFESIVEPDSAVVMPLSTQIDAQMINNAYAKAIKKNTGEAKIDLMNEQEKWDTYMQAGSQLYRELPPILQKIFTNLSGYRAVLMLKNIEAL